MKRIKFIYLLLSIFAFISCEDAKDPVISSGALDGTTTFKLFDTQYVRYELSNENASNNMESLTCQQPDYGFTASVTYTVQICKDASFAATTFQTLATTVKGEKIDLNVKEMDKAIIKLFGKSYTEKKVYVRLMAYISDATATPLVSTPIVKPLYSNAISFKVIPYELPLLEYQETSPAPYYIIGLGDGKSTNSVAGLGVSLIPLGVTDGKKYDLDGNGEYVYTGYFNASRSFKLIRNIGSSAEYWGMTGSVYTHNTGGNITVPTDGYYKITLNSIDNTLTIVATASSPASYTTIGLIGAFNGWGTDVALTPTETSNNHIWYTTFTLGADSEFKLRANAGWTNNWGAGKFPFGVGTNNGANIPGKTGTYVAMFNDIDGTFYFYKK
jgi:starch-binding outer membrane protein SusE/F